MKLYLYDGDTFEHKGKRFHVNFEHDPDADAPWDQGDGRGIVSDWETRDKKPGERVLMQDGRNKLYFDWAGTMKKARAEGWDAEPYKTGTKGEQAARAVAHEFEYLRAWCADEWEYVGVIVTMLDRNGEECGSDSLWFVETWKDYHQEVARELADNLIAEKRHESARKAKETRERNYWAARDVPTI